MTGNLLGELHRRRVLRTVSIYVVGAWLMMQAADVFFPAWGLPDSSINVLLITAVLGFPVVLIFGWFYDITEHGIVRTMPASAEQQAMPLGLRGWDYALLLVLLSVVSIITYDAVQKLLRTAANNSLEADFRPSELAQSKTVIAVLPFANSTADPANEPFCDGISEEILHKLARINGLQVIGRTSSFQFKNSGYTVARIARLLGARYLLQGSVRRSGKALRIIASLVDQNGVQQWSQAFNRQAGAVFEIQSEIAEVVSATITPSVSIAAREEYRPDPYVYQSYLEGRELVRKRDQSASKLLQRAVALDPDFAAAHAELAISLMVGLGNSRDYEAAKNAFEAALAINPALPRALAARALYLQEGVAPAQWEKSEEYLNAALTAEPAMVDAMNWLSSALGAQGKYEQQLQVLEKAKQIDPLHGVLTVNLASIYTTRGRFDDAENLLRKLLELPDPPATVYYSLREFYLNTGKIADMIAISKVQANKVEVPYYGLALGYALLNMWDPAEYWINRSRQDYPDFQYIGFGIYSSMIDYWQGNLDQSLRELESAISANSLRADKLQPTTDYILGIRQALTGRFSEAAVRLEKAIAVDPQLQRYLAKDAGLTLAWAYRELDQPEQVERILRPLIEDYSNREKRGVLNVSQELYHYALIALLQGDNAQALSRFRKAFNNGWRQLIFLQHDARWNALRDNPQFRVLLEAVKEDLEEQRAKVERADDQFDFIDAFERERK
ncbi:MAG: tetratricopeptide repeat protein [Pseudomonadota bacterium]